jgi:hypothetical protein
MPRKLILTIISVALLLWAVGCSENSLEPEADVDAINQDEFGGFDAKTEAPAFGDADLSATESEEVVVDDPLLGSPLMDSLVTDIEAGVIHFRAVWGRLVYDSTVTEITDWTGSLTLSRGGAAVRRLIRFEEGQDKLLERTERELVEWESFTTVHNDGIAVDLYVPRLAQLFDTSLVIEDISDTTLVIDTVGTVIDTTVIVDEYVDTTFVATPIDPEPFMLDFVTGPYSRSFTFDELAQLDTIVQLDDGNAIAFHAVRVYRNRCPRGFLHGRWGRDEDGNGLFRGQWTDQHGILTGWVNGTYETTEQGRNIFYGKWIDRTGRFEGFLRGTWRQHPNVSSDPNAVFHAGGWLMGAIYNANREEIGVLKGHYVNVPNLNGGFFQARWRLHCGMIQPEDDSFGEGDSTGPNIDPGTGNG